MIYAELGDFNTAINSVDQAIAISKDVGARNRLFLDYHAKAMILSTMGDYKGAFEYQTMYSELRNEVLNEENIAKMNELEVQYQTEKKEKENLIQRNRIQTLEHESRIATLQRIGLVVLILIGFAIFGAIYYGLKQKNLRVETERSKLDSELNYAEKNSPDSQCSWPTRMLFSKACARTSANFAHNPAIEIHSIESSIVLISISMTILGGSSSGNGSTGPQEF